jgi:hypothetical protein
MVGAQNEPRRLVDPACGEIDESLPERRNKGFISEKGADLGLSDVHVKSGYTGKTPDYGVRQFLRDLQEKVKVLV